MSSRSTGVLERLRAHFCAGEVGTARELGDALDLPEGSVAAALKYLRSKGEVEDIGTKTVACLVGYGKTINREVLVWGSCERDDLRMSSQDLVRTAIAARRPLELAWAGAFGGKHAA